MPTPPVDPDAIARAAAVLRAGGLVAMPTETVYGLAADARNDAAIRAVFAAKGRPSDHPVIVHVADAGEIDTWAADPPPAATRLAVAFWPGPLTLVLRRRAGVSDLITGGQDTVGLRCPAHPWAQALLRAFGGAVVAPSANRYGRISPTRADHVRADLGLQPQGVVDLVLDGGPCPVGIESTIVDLSGPRPRLLRPGAVSVAQLEAVLGGTVVAAADGDDAPRAPGRHKRHYAPRTVLEIVPPAELAARVGALAPQTVAVLAPAWAIRAEPNLRLHLLAADAPEDYARLLYDHLHRLDASGADRLLVAEPPDGAAWQAVRDRLQRASAGSAA
jgi:L-threonylcarbamoyladenylate synthase